MNAVDPSSLTVLVTGATSGYGLATAKRFHEAGATVVLTGRRAERLASLKAEWGDRAHTLCFDVTDKAAVDEALSSLDDTVGPVDVLVNNAGLALGLDPAWEADLSDWETMLATNVRGLLYCTRKLLPGMVERDRGHVINISSIAGNWPYPGGHVYGGTKAFVTQFSLNLRADLVGHQVRVTNIEPGLSQTEFSLVRFKGDEQAAAAPYSGVQPLTGDDIAEAVFWAATLPPHVNINRIEVMPTMQANGPFRVHRED